MNLMLPKKMVPENITWAEVMALCRRASVGEHTARKLFWREDSPARKLLHGRTRALYVRIEVLRELGLKETDS